MEIKFGDKIIFTAQLWRSKRKTFLNGEESDKRVWDSYSNKPTEAIFLGYRTLQNGEMVGGYDLIYGHSEDPPEQEYNREFVPKEYFKACLVCQEGHNPVYVMEKDMEIIS